MLQKQKVSVVGFVDESGAEIVQPKEMTYLLLFYASDPDTGDEERRFEIIDGRFWVCDRIMNAQNQYEYGLVNIFKSQIISEKVTSFLTNSISFYTFLRYCIGKGVKVGNDGENNYMSVEELNEFVMAEYYVEMNEMGIYDEEDLDRFYDADFHHNEYIPSQREEDDNTI